MDLVAAIGLGILIGLSLGALGGGGSILTVPALVYVIGEPARSATTESLVIVGVTALVASIGHARAGNVRWGAGLAFGVTGVAASYLGTALNRTVNPDVLLLAFAGLVVIAASAMLIRLRAAPRQLAAVGAGAEGQGAAIVAEGADTPRTRPASSGINPATVAKVLAAGLLVGFLTGFFGVGGGFVIVPALVMALGFDMTVAVGTSLLVIAINSAAAMAARAGSETFHWSVIIPFTAAAILGSLAGRRVAGRVSQASLTRAFAALLFAVAVYVAIRSIAGLVG